jgi:hypothetical protein
MEKNKTYIIVCRGGKTKDTCPLILEKGWCCAECTYSGYILREHIKNEDEKEDINVDEKDG